MSDLLTIIREHDLPPRWDGHAVVWLGWEYANATTMQYHLREKDLRCGNCGDLEYERGFPLWSNNRGIVANSADLAHEDWKAEEAARNRLPDTIRGKLPRRWRSRLTAARCHHCNLDTVHDWDTKQSWVLDHTDYGPEGSTAP